MEKHYDAERIEGELQAFWEENGIYKYDSKSKKETYSIDTPPPTVSGKLHIGHIFSYTQAEIIARFKRMQGYNVFYPFGFDDNGLPTERLVEREEHIKAKDFPREEMAEKCSRVAQKYEAEFRDLWQSLGFSVDWDLQYETINPRTMRISQKLFLELARKKKAYCKESPVLWCTECQTSIAQAELETAQKETYFNYIPFEVEKEQLIVATTRPEFLAGVVCLFVNGKDERYKKYIGKSAITPLYHEVVPILEDDEVEQDKGTGIVMCATFGDTTDVSWYEKHHLPYKKIMCADGRMNEAIPIIGGMRVERAREAIVEALKAQGLLIKQEKLMHTVAIHERCGKSIEIIPSKQWYIDILTDKDRYLQAADEINWYPQMMKNRYISWVKNLKWDWCISRQRYFGVPLPIWYCKNCGKVILAEDEDLPINPLKSSPKQPCECGCHDFIPESAVMDTWATSSISPLINKKWQEMDERRELQIPLGLRTQAHEIIRTWAFYTIVRSLYHTGKLPWKDIMISGFVLAKKGEKISKSKNNVGISPRELIKKHSADAVRYWAANARLGADTFFGEDELAASKKLMNKLWNASKFAFMHLADFDGIELNDAQGEYPSKQLSHGQIEPLCSDKLKLLPSDRWILERAKQTMSEARRLLNEYEVGLARHEIDEFFWSDFCDYYLEIVKDRLYKPEIHGERERRGAQYALYHTLLTLLELYAIYIPYETEHIYQAYFRQYEKTLSLHQREWKQDEKLNERLLGFGKELKATISEMRKYKSEHNLSMKAEMQHFTIKTTETYKTYFEQEEKDIKACGSIKELEIESAKIL